MTASRFLRHGLPPLPFPYVGATGAAAFNLLGALAMRGASVVTRAIR
ncbi:MULTISPECIES: hypothetical protein [unclassified Stenotrophomonas]